MTEERKKKEITLKKVGDKVYVDELVKEIMHTKKHVLKELASK